MTKEEAIKGLKVLAKDFSGYKPNEEMFDMAIKALEQPECEDAVSRKWLIEAAEEGRIKFDRDGYNYNRYIHLVRDIAPSVTPKQPGWIPCSERLPEEGGNYYVTQFRYDVYDPDMTGTYICETDYIWYSTLRKKWSPNGNCKVVAWMPLSEPWGGGQDES